MSQDASTLYFNLNQLVDHFETPSAVEYFKSEEARKQDSKARLLIESGRDWILDMKDVVTAKVLFAAILLGGKTLLVYRDCLLNMAENKQDPIRKKLKNLLEVKYYGVGFEDIFAKWLSCNLHRLNDLSVRLL